MSSNGGQDPSPHQSEISTAMMVLRTPTVLRYDHCLAGKHSTNEHEPTACGHSRMVKFFSVPILFWICPRKIVVKLVSPKFSRFAYFQIFVKMLSALKISKAKDAPPAHRYPRKDSSGGVQIQLCPP